MIYSLLYLSDSGVHYLNHALKNYTYLGIKKFEKGYKNLKKFYHTAHFARERERERLEKNEAIELRRI